MNPHFVRGESDFTFQIPYRAFGRIDHIVWPSLHNKFALVAFDLIDAEWLDRAGRSDAKFSMDGLSNTDDEWQYFMQQPARGRSNPFETTPLYRLETELPIGTDWFGSKIILPGPDDPGHENGLSVLEAIWFEFTNFKQSDPTNYTGLLFSSLYNPGVPVVTKGKLPTVKQGQALSKIFSLSHLPTASSAIWTSALSRAEASNLGVYDVGQGNANALLDKSRGIPSLYFDLGAGVYRNVRTTPVNLTFCFTNNPSVILSHWDVDHWAGAYTSMVNGLYPALKLTWIAPLQNIGPVHLAFAHDVISSGGNFYIYSALPSTVGTVTLSDSRTVKYTIGIGSDRNGSGIVLAVENFTSEAWLLTGDCDYRHFVSAMSSSNFVAIVAPHHGADLHKSSAAPHRPSGSRYAKLIYSFGKGNLHGTKTGVSHPTSAGVSKHAAAGWSHGLWSLKTPGTPVPGADVLATCEHSPGTMRGGAIIGWSSAPAGNIDTACSNLGCSASLPQS